MSTDARSLLFERLVRPHLDRLYRLAWRLTGARPEAEDLFQELLVKAFRMLDELAAIDEPGSWLSRVMYNLFVDRHRRFARERLKLVEEARLPGRGIDDLAGGDDPELNERRAETRRRLESALAMLSEAHRIVVLLHDAEGYKLEEIADITGVALGTVKSRLHRARARLKEILESDGTFFDGVS